MKYTQEQILNALSIIQETCGEKHCDNNCPFRTFDDECWFMDKRCAPADWQLNTSDNWKAIIGDYE